ncbi:MAG: NAD-dependent epimerase/dehydratase family protein [Elusimicrobia bacterium]|nr:NAD-dependent epimerase/dehydratase family protein [Elusimicrobiota bacterium]
MRVFVTGGAGFIASNLCERLLQEGHHVTAFDNLLLGRLQFIAPLRSDAKFRFIKGDLLNPPALKRAITGHQAVFHMACNSDIQKGTLATDTDLKLGTLATYNVLEAMRLARIRQIVFASTSAVYGESTALPTPEDYGPLLPISLYGASKLAAEALISSFGHCYNVKAWIFRFANIVGKNGTHGALVDFIRKLRRNPRRLEILGDGRQAKPYLHVADCVDGMMHGWEKSRAPLNVFNLTPDDRTNVRDIARIIVRRMGLPSVRFAYTGGSRGWPGDVARVLLDGRRMKKLGWKPPLRSDQAVKKAVDDLLGQL